MVDKRHRTSMSGIKVMEDSSWGLSKARERYGSLKQPDMRPKDVHAPQKLSDATNLQGPGYSNIHRKDWVRGFGKGGVESAEGKPGYVPGFKGKK
jgi:hypothetical protein